METYEILDRQKKYVELRAKLAKDFRPETEQREALIKLLEQLLMIFNANASKDLHYSHEEWSCFLKSTVRPAVRKIGETAFKIAGMQGMYRVCDMFNTVQVKTTGAGNHPSVQELDRIWDGVGDKSGEPVRDFWLS